MTKIRIITAIALFLWLTGIVIPLFLPYSPVPALLYPWLKLSYSFVCHQNPLKTMEIQEYHVLVCSRCFGIYFGAFISSLAAVFVYLRRKLPLRYLFISVIPMIADIILYSSHVYSYSKITAFFTGLLSGSVAFFYILNGIEEFITEKKLKEGK